MRPYRFPNLLLIILMAAIFSLSCVAQSKSAKEAKDAQAAQAAQGVAGNYTYPGTNWPADYPVSCDQSKSVVNGKVVQQSPINLTNPTKLSSLTLTTYYFGATVPVGAAGHFITVDYTHAVPKNYVVFGGKTYNLVGFHFHLPAEHKIEGSLAQMEVHLVNKASDGSLLVIGVMINGDGTANQGFDKILTHIGTGDNIDPVQMIPGANNSSSLKYYTYQGSLTTPTCTPPVTWVVLKGSITISISQFEKYVKLNNGQFANNARILQDPITNLVINSNF